MQDLLRPVLRAASRALIPALALAACAGSPATPSVDPSPATIITPSQATWEALNPARGDASPRAATLWGDRKAAVATGFLVQFKDGFSSPPHIHNVTYRGVVIEGQVHNDDANAEPMWMPAGSYWTQPKGAAHITAARGAKNVAYIEIDDGPYLVRPIAQATDTGERPINVDASNLVWVDAGASAQIAYLWSDARGAQPGGVFLKVPAKAAGFMRSPQLRAVVVRGQAEHRLPGKPAVALPPGSFMGSDGGSVPIACAGDGDGECVFYVRTDGGLTVSAR